LRKALYILADQDKDGAAEILQNITKSTDGTYKGVRSPDALKSDKQINFIFNRVKEMYSKQFDWPVFEAKGQVAPLALKGNQS
jgi:hypothetical protein